MSRNHLGRTKLLSEKKNKKEEKIAVDDSTFKNLQELIQDT